VTPGKLTARAPSAQPHARRYVRDASLQRFLVRDPFDAAHGDLRIPWLIALLTGPVASPPITEYTTRENPWLNVLKIATCDEVALVVPKAPEQNGPSRSRPLPGACSLIPSIRPIYRNVSGTAKPRIWKPFYITMPTESPRSIWCIAPTPRPRYLPCRLF